MAECLEINDIAGVLNDMRKRRNKSLYGGGPLISAKNAQEYFDRVKKYFQKGEEYLNTKRPRLV